MKTLLIMRHAKSSWKDEGMADHDRPLNRRGQEAAPRMGRLLRRQNVAPARVFSSTARRARETAELVLAASGWPAELLLRSELYLAPPERYMDVLRSQAGSADCLMLVGHNPGLHQLVWQLTGVEDDMPTGAVARVELPIDDWSDVTMATRGELRDLWRPRDEAGE